MTFDSEKEIIILKKLTFYIMTMRVSIIYVYFRLNLEFTVCFSWSGCG